MSRIDSRAVAGSIVEEIWAEDIWAGDAPGPQLAWLGQAGFAIRWAGVNLLIDPYLSDHLAEKYAGTRFPHRRLMPPPLAIDRIARLDYVICTHRHSDHMDPPTLRRLADRQPDLRFVLPEALFEHAIETIGLPAQRLIGMDAGRRLQLGAHLYLDGIAAAHESLDTDDQGRHRFLGYALSSGDQCIYHSGDCVPYEGLADRVRRHAPQLALLPVNGRSPYLQQAGVPGNFHLDEAITLCMEAGIPSLMAHHFGMFAFNTLAPEQIDAAAERDGAPPELIRPHTDRVYCLIA
ncbi:MBL fold metallo-hydrolase [Salinisphaera sp.]|uniref:MBL fold metallo-hydrolase n=1 Tax=Salinisphaera sp. TaxID=1914330 RepID=UPI002D783997|nr:MBL fold metallo-hydrolase [Salinisphaera sp.]HET7314419.1 MBL fold metallo-hydrolase [Salinisphaera sp.]